MECYHQKGKPVRCAINKPQTLTDFVNVDSFCHVGDEAILDHVGNLKGSLEVQTSVVQEIIEEAELFKKRALIDKLSTHLAHLQERLSPNSDEIEVSKKKR